MCAELNEQSLNEFMAVMSLNPDYVLHPSNVIDQYMQKRIFYITLEREHICEDFLWSGAFLRDICAIEIQGDPYSWRIA